jgi:Flp pilus assembly protein TadG
LLLLLFGIAELSLVFADAGALTNASAQAARAGSLGDSIETIQSVATNSLPANITLPAGNIVLQHRSLVSGSWTAWATLADQTNQGVTTNNAASGDQIQVTLTYAHPLITSVVLQNSKNGKITLTGVAVALRY